MNKIKITEEQYKKLMSIDEAEVTESSKEECKDDETSKEDESKEDLFESVEKTFGDLEVRNLIAEGDDIKGEVKTAFGPWKNMTWDKEGNVKNLNESVFKKLSYKLVL